MLLLGAHCSISGGYHNAIFTAQKLKCSCLQIFVKNQRQWLAGIIDEKAVQLWNEARNNVKPKIVHVIAHSSYLINLASDDASVRKKSIAALHEELERCNTLGINRYVIHPGSHKGKGFDVGMKHLTRGLNTVLSKINNVTILLETTAGAGNSMGSTIEEISEMIRSCDYPEKLGCCIDTCHLFVSGYELWPAEKIEQLIDKIDTLIGLDNLGCIHLNDSMGKIGSHLDRHEQIAKGYIGIEPFRHIMCEKRLKNIPKIIETPKSPDAALDFDDQNLTLLRKLSRKSP